MSGEDASLTIQAEVDGTAATAVETGPSEDDALGAVFDKLVTNNGAERGDDGKFASDKQPEKAAETDADAGTEAKPAEAASTAAPAHLPQAIKAHWDKLPEEARAAVAAHQTEMDKKFGEVGRQYQAVKPIADKLNEAISTYEDFKGMSPEQVAKGVGELAAVQVSLGRNPVGTIIEIAKHYKVLPQLANVFAGQGKQEGQAGDQGQLITGLHQKISNLEAQLKQVSNPEKFRETVSSTIDQTMAKKEAEKSLSDWSKDQPHYSDVEADLPFFIAKVIEQKGRERPHKDILSDAYDMAINANPEVRAKVRAAEAKATAATPDPKRAEAARKAASINVKSSANGRDRSMTEEEAMSSAYDRAMAATH